MDGVTHKGKLNKQELADLYEQSSIMAYPSTFPETQCQAVLDAQYHGCIPVTSSLGALQETNNGGYTLPPDVPMTSNHYLAILIGAREQVSEGRRLAAREFASVYTWKALYKRINSEILGV
jgi:glycosyltransferase involved in cell wall biosynthesis